MTLFIICAFVSGIRRLLYGFAGWGNLFARRKTETVR
jgi:hypothetical protein